MSKDTPTIQEKTIIYHLPMTPYKLTWRKGLLPIPSYYIWFSALENIHVSVDAIRYIFNLFNLL